MPRDARIVIDEACYHIITRGNQRQRVFMQEVDFREYLKRLLLYKRAYRIRLYGYCLMPNHIHLIIQSQETMNLARFMQGLNSSHTAYFNNKYRKVGHLWQGRYKSKIIVKDKYLLDCINYIELNPVRANMVSSPCEYQWSSYKERNLDTGKMRGLLDEIDL